MLGRTDAKGISESASSTETAVTGSPRFLMRRVVIRAALLAAVALAACSPTRTNVPTPAATKNALPPVPSATETTFAEPVNSACAGSVPWNEASQHIGEDVTVQGPVASTNYAVASNGSPTFLNVGNAYPDPDRFVVVIWGEDRANFPVAPEAEYAGKTICLTGTVSDYQAVPEIEATDPGQIHESTTS
jgi:hypothetical protein